MNAWRIFLALFAVLAFGASMPVWMHFTRSSDLLTYFPAWSRFLVQLVPVGIVLLFIASWLQPGGETPS